MPEQLGHLLGGDDAARGPGHRNLDRRVGGGVEGHLAAIRAHHHDFGADILVFQTLADRAELPVDHRLDEGVADRGRGAEVLLPLRQHFVGDRDWNVRCTLGKDFFDQKLVLRRQIRVHQNDGDRLRSPLCAARVSARARTCASSSFSMTPPVGPMRSFISNALLALDERLRLHPGEIIVIAAIAAADERHVAKAARRQVPDYCAFAFEQRIRRDRRTEADRANLVGGAERLEAGHHAFDRIAAWTDSSTLSVRDLLRRRRQNP